MRVDSFVISKRDCNVAAELRDDGGPKKTRIVVPTVTSTNRRQWRVGTYDDTALVGNWVAGATVSALWLSILDFCYREGMIFDADGNATRRSGRLSGVISPPLKLLSVGNFSPRKVPSEGTVPKNSGRKRMAGDCSYPETAVRRQFRLPRNF